MGDLLYSDGDRVDKTRKRDHESLQLQNLKKILMGHLRTRVDVLSIIHSPAFKPYRCKAEPYIYSSTSATVEMAVAPMTT